MPNFIEEMNTYVLSQHLWGFSYFGYWARKYPTDFISMAEIIHISQPDFIIETGTSAGGTTLFFATMLDVIGKGRVISIELERNVSGRNNDTGDLPVHPRIDYLYGSSVSDEIYKQVEDIIKTKDNPTILLNLDSDHRYEHVIKELEMYQKFVPDKGFIIIDDTNTTGPDKARDEFLEKNKDFIIYQPAERFLITLNPGGYLRRD